MRFIDIPLSVNRVMTIKNWHRVLKLTTWQEGENCDSLLTHCDIHTSRCKVPSVLCQVLKLTTLHVHLVAYGNVDELNR